MYSTRADNHDDRNGYNHVWQAVSDDEVHWREPARSSPGRSSSWAMGVWQAGGRFYLNHGSFTGTDTQNVLRFWESADLWTWTYIGEKADLTPDPRWYDPNSRFDCMDVISAEENGRTSYHGIASGPGGWLRSDDGVHWEGPAPFKVRVRKPATCRRLSVRDCRMVPDRRQGQPAGQPALLRGQSRLLPLHPGRRLRERSVLAGCGRLPAQRPLRQIRQFPGETLPNRAGAPRQQLHVRRLGLSHGGTSCCLRSSAFRLEATGTSGSRTGSRTRPSRGIASMPTSPACGCTRGSGSPPRAPSTWRSQVPVWKLPSPRAQMDRSPSAASGRVSPAGRVSPSEPGIVLDDGKRYL